MGSNLHWDRAAGADDVLLQPATRRHFISIPSALQFLAAGTDNDVVLYERLSWEVQEGMGLAGGHDTPVTAIAPSPNGGCHVPATALHCCGPALCRCAALCLGCVESTGAWRLHITGTRTGLVTCPCGGPKPQLHKGPTTADFNTTSSVPHTYEYDCMTV